MKVARQVELNVTHKERDDYSETEKRLRKLLEKTILQGIKCYECVSEKFKMFSGSTLGPTLVHLNFTGEISNPPNSSVTSSERLKLFNDNLYSLHFNRNRK